MMMVTPLEAECAGAYARLRISADVREPDKALDEHIPSREDHHLTDRCAVGGLLRSPLGWLTPYIGYYRWSEPR